MDLQAWIKNYYNISTAYENLLYGDNLTRQDRQVEISTTGVSLPTSTDGAANTIWANTMTSDVGTALGLKDKKSWWRVSPSCFGGGLCGAGRARR